MGVGVGDDSTRGVERRLREDLRITGWGDGEGLVASVGLARSSRDSLSSLVSKSSIVGRAMGDVSGSAVGEAEGCLG